MSIPTGIRSTVARAPADTEFTFVIEWDDKPALDAAGTLGTRQEKRAAMQSVMDDVKAPLLDELRRQPAMDVNDIAGSGHAVASASAATWRTVFESPTLRSPAVRLNPNAPFFTT